MDRVARDAGHLEAAETLVQAEPAVCRPGHGDRQHPALRHALQSARAIRLDTHALTRPTAGVEPEQLLVGRAPDLGEQVAADAAHVWPDDAQDEIGGDRRVHRGATVAQHVDAC